MCFISPDYSLWTYDCTPSLLIRAVMADLTQSGKCFPPRKSRAKNRKRKRGSRAGVAVKANAAAVLEKNQLVQRHNQRKLGVNYSNLNYIQSAVVSSGTSSLPLESGTVDMALLMQDHVQIRRLL